MKRTILLCLAFAATMPATSAAAVAYPSDTVSSTKAPWVAALYLGTSGTDIADFQRICTGSLVDSRHVLTAAHCVAGEHPSDLTVALGGSSMTDSSLYQVADFEMHQRYTVPTTANEVALPNDIALLRLSEPVIGIQPVRLAPAKDLTMRSSKAGMALYGWGVDQNGVLGDNMGYTKQRDFSSKAKSWFRGFNSKTQIAAGLQRNREKLFSGACYGDSGGPLVGYDAKRRPYVLGVVSYGDADCKAAAPTVYSRVSAYRSWVGAARAKMVSRIGRVPIEYAVADQQGDATSTGPNGRAADITSAYVNSSTSDLTVSLVLPAAENVPLSVVMAFLDHSGQTFAYLSDEGLFNKDGAPVCAGTSSWGYSAEGYYSVTLGTSAECVYRTFAVTSFDIQVLATTYADESYTVEAGTDWLPISFVSLYMP